MSNSDARAVTPLSRRIFAFWAQSSLIDPVFTDPTGTRNVETKFRRGNSLKLSRTFLEGRSYVKKNDANFSERYVAPLGENKISLARRRRKIK